MNGSAEHVFDLVRGGKGVEERRRCGMTGGVCCVGGGRFFGFASGRVGRPRRRAERRCAFAAGRKGFRRGDSVARARIVRMARLEDRQHPSGACRGVERDLPQFILFEMHAVSYHVTGFPI